MKFDSVIFDLDGTLWDTSLVCAQAWNNVLHRHQIPFREIVEADVASVTGLPHRECIETVFEGLPKEQIEVLVRETLTEDNVMIEQLGGKLYPGVESGLEKLAQSFDLFIVSNCQSGYIETFLEWSGFQIHFKDFECWGNTGEPKANNLRNLMSRNSLKDALFVGDADSDRIAARENHIPFYFVEYGFGLVEECEARFSSFDELTRELLK